MRTLAIVALVLIVIGALNWGLIGFFGFNLVTAIFGTGVLSRIIYALVGLAGVYGIAMLVTLGERRDNVCVPYETRMHPAA
jgi:uncharacterized membrane protein YuzA (DUF378 family)